MKLIQIIQTQWEEDNGRLVSTLFGLSADGNVYKWIGRGWKAIGMEVVGGDKI